MKFIYIIVILYITKCVVSLADYKYIYLFYNRDPAETHIESLKDPVGHPRFSYSGTPPHRSQSGLYFGGNPTSYM